MANKTRPITFDTGREIGRTLPGVEEGTAYGSPALKIDGQMFACVAVHRSAEPGSLVVCVDVAQRDEMLAAGPETYYVTDRYVEYPMVLVRLARIHRDALRDLLGMASQYVTAKGRRRTSGRSKRVPRL